MVDDVTCRFKTVHYEMDHYRQSHEPARLARTNDDGVRKEPPNAER
jgi:hypothetical protein